MTHMWPICDPYVTHMWPYVTHMWPICDPYVTHMWPICDLLGLMVKPCSAPWRDCLRTNVEKTSQGCSYWSGNGRRETAQHARGNFMKKIVCDPYVTLVFYQKISHHTTLRMTMYLVFEKMPFFVVSSTISWGNCEIYCLHHVLCHLALSRPVLVVFCVLWVTCDILQMYTRWGYVVYYWNHPLTLHTFSNALQFKTFSVNSRSCKRKPIS